MKSSYRVLTFVVLLSLLLAACGGGGTTTPAPVSEAAPTQPVAPEQPTEAGPYPPPSSSIPTSAAGYPAPGEPVTLQVWDILTRDVESEVIDTLISEFEAAHPGVTVERTVKTFDDMKATARLGLSSPDGPDIAQINQGLSDMGALVKADLLVDLTPYAQQYGWFDKISPSIVARNSFTPGGEVFGEGSLYGMPITAELIGVFYNKEKFEAAGVGVPTTFAEFEAALDALQAAGEVPVAFGNLDKFPVIHTYSEIQGNLVDRAYLDDFIFGRNNQSFDIPENVQAADKLVEWNEKGYFTPGYEGIGYEDSWKLLSDEQSAAMITGSWISGDLLAGANGDKFGFFLTPPAEAGGMHISVGGTSTAFAIRKGTPNEQLAAEFIDLMVSDRAGQLWLEKGIVPVQPVDTSTVQAGTLNSDMVAAWNYLNENDLVGHYLDWATPTFYDTITAALAELLADRITSDEFVAQVQEDYEAYIASKGQ
jgi:raffinose/stachyose/melibiose transport system substrate-binding protein